jgi:hypothetical protein
MKRICLVLIRLYPYDFRLWFGREVVDLAQNGGLREIGGLVAGAAREWIAKWTTATMIRGRALPDIRMKRPVGVPQEVWFRPCSSDTFR